MNVELWIKVTCGACGFSYCLGPHSPTLRDGVNLAAPCAHAPAMAGGMEQKTKNEPAFLMVNEK